MKYADSLFTNITKSQVKNDINLELSSALSLFVRDKIDESNNYYASLLGKNADNISANNFFDQLKDSNPIKSFLNKKILI